MKDEEEFRKSVNNKYFYSFFDVEDVLSYFAYVVEGGQLKNLGKDIKHWPQETPKLLIGIVEV